MVLTGRSAALTLVLSLVLLGGCSESLFGAHGSGSGSGPGDGGGGDDGGVTGCTDPCNADAAAEFDGTARGAHGQWRYLDDHRDRTWAPMAVGNQVMTGAENGTQITTCSASPGEPACAALGNALLVSTITASKSDPAIELAVAEPQVLELHVEAFVPGGGASQTIRLYRNSRDDELFTGTAMPGTKLDHKITVAVIPGDRFLVAVASTPTGATSVGLNLFARVAGTFPANCQVAVPFTTATGNTVVDLCGGTLFTHYSTPGPTPPSLDVAPFPEQGKGALLKSGESFGRGLPGATTFPLLDWSQDVTVQFWTAPDAVSTTPTVVFSDLDPDYGSGIEIYLTQSAVVTLTAEMDACTSPSLSRVYAMGTYPDPSSWHFIRAVRTGGALRVCVDGSFFMSAAISTPCTNPSGYPPVLGAQASGSASFSGRLDDVRVFTGALPCGPTP